MFEFLLVMSKTYACLLSRVETLRFLDVFRLLTLCVHPGVKRPGRGVNDSFPSNAEDKERVELYLYSHSGLSWPVLGRTLPFTFYLVSKDVGIFGKPVTSLKQILY